MAGNKYGAKKIRLADGTVFDSKKEYNRWCELKLLERAKKITDLQRQVKYVLIPAQVDESGKVIEKECSYYADFTYYDFTRKERVVEDAKGCQTDVFKLKKKLMLWVHGIRITIS